MKSKRWLILLASLGVILLASSTGVTRASFLDLEMSSGNAFEAWTSILWKQTTQSDFESGLLNNVDTSSSAGNVKLEGVLQEPTTSVGSEESWYADWSYRKKITIDHTQVDANLADFPVLISLPSDANLAADAQSDGDDILFTSSNGITKLSHEIEGEFDDSTGKLVAWVEVPVLSDDTDTDVYMYYGNSTCGNQQNITDVWDSNYKMVQHLQEDPTGPDPAFKDSTSNDSDGSNWGSMTPSDQVIGQVDGSIDFDGINDRINLGNIGTLSNDTFSISVWVRVTNASPRQEMVWGAVTGSSDERFRFEVYDTWINFHDDYNMDTWTSSGTIEADKWYHVVATYDYPNQKASIYLNGEFKASDTSFSQASNALGGLQIGSRDGACYLNGVIDEVRISNSTRSAEWIKTCYNNQNSPSSFHTVGSEESWYYTSWSRRAPVTISNPGSDLTDYQVKVDVTYDADMQLDFDDIRFVDSDDSTELSHWRESYTAPTSAIFWVKVPSIPSGNKIIYMYYGNDAASSASDGTATFLFFDDFEEHAVGEIPDGWTIYPGCSGVVVQDDAGNKVLDDGIGGGGNVIAGDPTWTDVAVRQKVRSVDDVISHAGAVVRYTDESNEVYGGIVTDTTAEIWNMIGGTWTKIGGTWTIPDVGTSWHVQELRIAGNTVELYIDDTYIGSGTLTSGAPSSGASGFWCQYSHQGYRDEHIVRKYAPQSTYVSSGTIASRVLNTGIAGASWDALFWDETRPSNTDISFEVRASDNLFTKDAEPNPPSVPDWTSVGGSSPVTSGLPSGRYMQWRATLTTSDTSKTPTLHEVRVYHY